MTLPIRASVILVNWRGDGGWHLEKQTLLSSEAPMLQALARMFIIRLYYAISLYTTHFGGLSTSGPVRPVRCNSLTRHQSSNNGTSSLVFFESSWRSCLGPPNLPARLSVNGREGLPALLVVKMRNVKAEVEISKLSGYYIIPPRGRS